MNVIGCGSSSLLFTERTVRPIVIRDAGSARCPFRTTLNRSASARGGTTVVRRRRRRRGSAIVGPVIPPRSAQPTRHASRHPPTRKQPERQPPPPTGRQRLLRYVVHAVNAVHPHRLRFATFGGLSFYFPMVLIENTTCSETYFRR